MKQEVKILSRKRFIPMLALMLIGILLILTGRANSHLFCYSIYIFDFPKRTEVIYFMGSVVGIFHFLYHTRGKQESKHTLITSSLGIVDSMFSAWGYSLVVDKAMNLGSGLLKELLGVEKYFIDASKVDYWSIGLVVLIILIIGVWKIWQMGQEAVFEIVHKMTEVSAPSINDASNSGSPTK